MITCTNYKSFTKGLTIGFADLHSDKWGGTSYGFTLCMKNGHRWVNFPSRKYTTPEGETKYMPLFKYDKKEDKDKFDLAAIEAIEKFCKKNGNNSEIEPPKSFYEPDV